MSDLDKLRARLGDLNDELVELDERRAAIQGQIDNAVAIKQATGNNADPDWFRRARGAHRHLGVERGEICTEIAETKRRIRQANNANNRDLFYKAVRDTVTPATWDLIVARHEQLRAEGDQ